MYLYYEVRTEEHQKFYKIQWDEVLHSGCLCYRLKLFWGRLGSCSETQPRECAYFKSEASLFAEIQQHHTRRMKHGYVRKAYVPIHKQGCFEFMEAQEQFEFEFSNSKTKAHALPPQSFELLEFFSEKISEKNGVPHLFRDKQPVFHLHSKVESFF